MARPTKKMQLNKAAEKVLFTVPPAPKSKVKKSLAMGLGGVSQATTDKTFKKQTTFGMPGKK